MKEEMIKSAELSEDRKFRYKLTRIWDTSKKRVLFIMLNPSTADSRIDDPTIRRCMGFCKSWGYGGFVVVNLFAYRSKTPKDLLNVLNPVAWDMSKFEKHWIESISECDKVVCAWGNSPIVKKLSLDHIAREWVPSEVFAIEISKDGTPKHPLYLKGDLVPIPYQFPKDENAPKTKQ